MEKNIILNQEKNLFGFFEIISKEKVGFNEIEIFGINDNRRIPLGCYDEKKGEEVFQELLCYMNTSSGYKNIKYVSKNPKTYGIFVMPLND